MRTLRAAALGFAAGVLWGAVARVFMRLLSTTPDFSWSGTLFILGVGAVAGSCIGVVHAARVAGRSGWWRLAAFPALILFAGPGMVLLPAAVGMAAVLRGGRVGRTLGAVVVAGSPLGVVLSDESLGVTPTQLVGLVLMVLSAVPLGWGIGEVVGRWRPRREGAAARAVRPTPLTAPVAHA
jgi:hypothetical protein